MNERIGAGALRFLHDPVQQEHHKMSEQSPLLIWEYKQLLLDIEATDEARCDIDFRKFCEDNPALYGKKGTEKRRNFQRRFQKLKEKTPSAYLQILDRHQRQTWCRHST